MQICLRPSSSWQDPTMHCGDLRSSAPKIVRCQFNFRVWIWVSSRWCGHFFERFLVGNGSFGQLQRFQPEFCYFLQRIDTPAFLAYRLSLGFRQRSIDTAGIDDSPIDHNSTYLYNSSSNILWIYGQFLRNIESDMNTGKTCKRSL